MKNILYLDVANSVESVRPAERKFFFDLLPLRDYKIFTFVKKQSIENNKNKNITHIDHSDKSGIGFYKDIYSHFINVIIRYNIDFVVVRNNIWLALIVLFSLKRYPKIKKIFIRAFPSEHLRIYNAKRHKYFKMKLSIIKNRLLIILANFLMKRFDIVFARSQSFTNYLSHKLNKEVFSLPMGFDNNWIVNSSMLNKFKKEMNPNNKVLIGYFGAIDMGRDIEFICQVFKNALESISLELEGLIITESPVSDRNKMNELLESYNLKNRIKIVGPFSYQEMPSVLSLLTLTISPIPPIPPYLVSSPTKTVESIGLGVPVVGNMEIKDQEFIINASGCGICVKYDVDDFVNGIRTILLHPDKEKMARNGISFINKYRTYEKITDHFESVIVQ